MAAVCGSSRSGTLAGEVATNVMPLATKRPPLTVPMVDSAPAVLASSRLATPPAVQELGASARHSALDCLFSE